MFLGFSATESTELSKDSSVVESETSLSTNFQEVPLSTGRSTELDTMDSVGSTLGLEEISKETVRELPLTGSSDRWTEYLSDSHGGKKTEELV